MNSNWCGEDAAEKDPRQQRVGENRRVTVVVFGDSPTFDDKQDADFGTAQHGQLEY